MRECIAWVLVFCLSCTFLYHLVMIATHDILWIGEPNRIALLFEILIIASMAVLAVLYISKLSRKRGGKRK